MSEGVEQLDARLQFSHERELEGSCSTWSTKINLLSARCYNWKHLLILQRVESAFWKGDVDMCSVITLGSLNACNGKLPAYHLHKSYWGLA